MCVFVQVRGGEGRGCYYLYTDGMCGMCGMCACVNVGGIVGYLDSVDAPEGIICGRGVCCYANIRYAHTYTQLRCMAGVI